MLFWLLFAAIALSVLAFHRASLRTSALVTGTAVLFYGFFGDSLLLFLLLLLLWAAVALPLCVPVLRQEWLSRPLMRWFSRVVQMLDPEALAALDAGTAWWEAELLGGAPDWKRFSALPPARLLPTEQAEVDAVIEAYRGRASLAEEAQSYLRAQHVFGMGIPRYYGGLEWSAVAQSHAISRIAAIDPAFARRLAAPERLAWIELLRRHGLDAQREQWLNRLAEGLEISGSLDPVAGDAVAVSVGSAGEAVTRLRLRLDTTVAAVEDPTAPFGLLIEVRDPDALLGGASGLSCVLVPAQQAGLEVDGGVLRANAVEIDLDCVIGGIERIGRAVSDWPECLAVGQAIASPALHAGIAAAIAAAAAGFARCHAPGTEPVGEWALAQESLALICARAGAAEALAAATALSVDAGELPQGLASVGRGLAAGHALDIASAAGDLGLNQTALRPLLEALLPAPAAEPLGRLGRPVGYTACVLRAHRAFRHAYTAVRQGNAARALEGFDMALWYHAGHMASSGVRALLLGLTAGNFSPAAGQSDFVRSTYRRVNRYSAAISFAADIALTRQSADLSSRRPRTARRAAHAAARLTLTTWLGDALANLFLACCALKRFEERGAPPAERAALDWICTDALRAVEEALDKVLRQLSSPLLSAVARTLIFPRGHAALAPSDAANRLLAQSQMEAQPLRKRLADCGPRLAPLVSALEATLAGEALEKRLASGSGVPVGMRIEDAVRGGRLDDEQQKFLTGWLASIRRLRRLPGAS